MTIRKGNITRRLKNNGKQKIPFMHEAENKNLNLSESEGLYECCNCGKVVDTKAEKATAECCKKDKN